MHLQIFEANSIVEQNNNSSFDYFVVGKVEVDKVKVDNFAVVKIAVDIIVADYLVSIRRLSC